MSPVKIFQIGFNRCGTKTIHDYLRANGLNGVHWGGGKLAKRIFANRGRGRDLLFGYEACEVFTDMEWLEPTCYLEAYKLYPELAAQYPNGVFILNTRECEDWINSRLCFDDGRYAALHKAYLKIRRDSDLIRHWRADWDYHHEAVMKFFSGSQYRFFICRIETDLPDTLNRMLVELDLDPSLYSMNDGNSVRYPDYAPDKQPGWSKSFRKYVKRQLRAALRGAVRGVERFAFRRSRASRAASTERDSTGMERCYNRTDDRRP